MDPVQVQVKVLDIKHVKNKQTNGDLNTEQTKAVASIQNEKLFKCKECWKTRNKNNYFRTKSLLSRHLRQCHSSTQYTCEICFKSFREPFSVKRHKRSVHSAADQISCSVCYKIYFNHSSLTKHMLRMHKLKTGKLSFSKCDKCSKEFACKSELKVHILEKHVKGKKFVCPVCSKKFIDLQSVDDHIEKKHTQNSTIICDICSAELLTKSGFYKHVRQFHSKHTFCSKCKKSFKNESEFKQHLEAMLGNTDNDRAFKCQICDLLCTSQCNLNWHKQSHIQKNSAQKNETKQDIEKEDGAAFKCELCFKIFDKKLHLTRHQKNIHQIYKWKCNFKGCFKSFGSLSLLKRHRCNGHGMKQYRCPVCQKSFQLSRNLETHRRLKHLNSKGLLTTAKDLFFCKLNECSFQTGEDKYLATHYQEKHGLPIVRLMDITIIC